MQKITERYYVEILKDRLIDKFEHILMRFGFDHVGLWLFVTDHVDMEKMNQYGGQSWTFIRNMVELPLEYSFFKVDKSDPPRFKVMQYQSEHEAFELLDIDSPDFNITWKYENPIKNKSSVREMRELVENHLNKHK